VVSGADRRGSARGVLWTVTAPKVGVGATTLVANLGVELAHTGRRTVAVDLDLECGDLAMFLDCGTHDALGVLAAHAHAWDSGWDPLFVAGALAHHASGLDLVITHPAPTAGPGHAPAAEAVVALLDRLRAAYDVVLVDAPPPLQPAAIAAIRTSDRVIVPTDLTLPCVRAAWRTLATLATAGVAAETITLVGTRCRPTPCGLTPDDLRELLGVPLATTLPSDEAAERALAVGAPLHAVDAGSALRAGIVALATALWTTPASAPAPAIQAGAAR